MIRITVFLVALVGLCMSSSFLCRTEAAMQDNLSQVIVYPNPFMRGVGHTEIIFDQCTATARLRIYKTTGQLVYDKTHDSVNGRISWGAVNDEGKDLSSGLYVYLLTDSGGHAAKGKLVIIR